MHGPTWPDDPQVREADELVQRVADGAVPPTGDRVGDALARWRVEVDDVTLREEPAISYFADARYGDPRHNPIAFLPADAPEGRITYGGVHDYAWPSGRHALQPHLPVYAAVRSDMAAEPMQDDLSDRDGEYELVNTPKLSPADEGVEQPPQDADWRPDGGEVA